MIIIDDVLVSDDIRDVHFLCDLPRCFGACCVEGDAGAPLEDEEVGILEELLEDIKPFMTEDGLEAVSALGVFDYDAAGGLVTPLNLGMECAFAYFEEGVARCAIEKAFEAGVIGFRKPVSCHLYPIRQMRVGHRIALNYHRWHICEPALALGKQTGLPLYRFLRDPLIRRFGAEWYDKLVQAVESKH
ncbi:MAG TPA: DUF3109 family protein [Bacteroidales bacterium]|jgi:hypothetical protein|nr:DUF3109 family protein [Lentimicrobiaceae bacterium]HOI00458.1 DUF3109 family protein [Bacteroidales bacterium]